MLNASCCCQRVRIRVTNKPKAMGICYCSRCRKVGASAIVFVEKSHIEILEGRSEIGTYHPESDQKYHRNFCTNCGTSLGEILSKDESLPLPANIFDDELPLEIGFTEYQSEMPKWMKSISKLLD